MAARKKKHLSDLYRRGVDITVADEESDEEVKVYIKKMNPLEAKEARDKGNAARARILMRRKDKDAPEYLTLYAEVFDYSREQMIDRCLGMEILQKRSQVEAEVAMDPDRKWAKDDYLDGLQEAWEDTLQAIYVDPEISEDEDSKKEANNAFEELQAFADEVDEVLKDEVKALKLPFEHMDDEELLHKAVEATIDELAYASWLEAYYAYRAFLTTRDPDDHSKKVFDSLREVEELEPEVYQKLLAGYQQIEIPDLEVKDLEQTPTS